jgi:hypothetical protein
VPREPFPLDPGFAAKGSGEIPATAETDAPQLRVLVDKIDGLSTQMGELAAHVQIVHKEAALTRKEVGDLRALVLTDHARRITAVERTTRKLRLPHVAKAGGALVGGGSLFYAILEWGAPLIKHWLESR